MATDTDSDPWQDLLATATASQDPIPKKHLVVCGEPSRGKRTLLERAWATGGTLDDGFRARNRAAYVAIGGAADGTEGPMRLDLLDDPRLKASEGAVVGYEWVDISQPGEPDRIPPLSVYTTPSSEPLMLQTLPHAIPKAPNDTGFLIVLDWSKPQTMIEDLLRWLTWIESWTAQMTSPEERTAGRQRLQSIIQHYGNSTFDATLPDVVLPLDPDTLVHNQSGISITIVLTHADTIRATGEKLIARGLVSGKGYSGQAGDESEAYLSGASWEERVEWMMQVVRTVALRYGASVIHTSTADPSTFTNLGALVLCSLYHLPATTPATTRLAAKLAHRFPCPHPPNALDRDRVIIPRGRDSPARIRVLRESFDVGRIGSMWDDELRRKRALRDLWRVVVPDIQRENHSSSGIPRTAQQYVAGNSSSCAGTGAGTSTRSALEGRDDARPNRSASWARCRVAGPDDSRVCKFPSRAWKSE
ncbi:hypothetical protein NliqN6_4392 [Naganishia liquefaciens]|uniref:ATP-binding protein n=1 Tax=Naganishia liquefaciens TaxID=104408 RepID=A0A8H3TWD3_9TREE|nr:hypothetical protein NliqN6_4392 [Naganishia liquefaciens]